MRVLSDIRVLRRGLVHDPKIMRACGPDAPFAMPITAEKTTKTTKTGT